MLYQENKQDETLHSLVYSYMCLHTLPLYFTNINISPNLTSSTPKSHHFFPPFPFLSIDCQWGRSSHATSVKRSNDDVCLGWGGFFNTPGSHIPVQSIRAAFVLRFLCGNDFANMWCDVFVCDLSAGALIYLIF